MKKRLLFVLLTALSVLLVTVLSGCGGGGSAEDFTKKTAGTWHRNGNLQDVQLEILDDGSWTTAENKDGSWETTEQGTLSYHKEYQTFQFETDDKFYPVSHNTQSGEVFHFRNDNYYREADSVDGFVKFDGLWYKEGNIDNEYFAFADGEWKWFEPQGMAHVSVESGNLAWNGSEGELVAFSYSDGEKFAIFTPADSGELMVAGEPYVWIAGVESGDSSGDIGEAASGDVSIITYDFYYLDGEVDDHSLFFYDGDQVDIDDGSGSVQAVYNIVGGEVVITMPDGTRIGTLTILEPGLLMDNDGGEFYAIYVE